MAYLGVSKLEYKNRNHKRASYTEQLDHQHDDPKRVVELDGTRRIVITITATRLAWQTDEVVRIEVTLLVDRAHDRFDEGFLDVAACVR